MQLFCKKMITIATAAMLSACTSTPHAQESSRTSPLSTSGTTVMNEATAATKSQMHIEHEGIEVDATFVPGDNVIHVTYAIKNASASPIVVFDRGDAHSVMIKRYALGEVPDLMTFEEKNGVAIFEHKAMSLPSPAPTSPPTPIGAKLDPGATLHGKFLIDRGLSGDISKIRWGINYVVYDAADYHRSAEEQGMTIVYGNFAQASKQKTVLSPVYDLTTHAFEKTP